MDWAQWHELFDSSPALIARLRAVRAHIARCLDDSPPGPIRVLSVCAGDGRDLIWALTDHPRAEDVRARLVELDPRLVEGGRAAAEAAGLGDRLTFVVGDATAASAYRDFAPADLVLTCGVFGNVRKTDTPRLVESLASLCRHGGFLIWTRVVTGPSRRASARPVPGRYGADPETIRALLERWSFEDVQIERTADGRFLVGTSRHRAEAPPLPAGERPLFVFTDASRGFDQQPL